MTKYKVSVDITIDTSKVKVIPDIVISLIESLNANEALPLISTMYQSLEVVRLKHGITFDEAVSMLEDNSEIKVESSITKL